LETEKAVGKAQLTWQKRTESKTDYRKRGDTARITQPVFKRLRFQLLDKAMVKKIQRPLRSIRPPDPRLISCFWVTTLSPAECQDTWTKENMHIERSGGYLTVNPGMFRAEILQENDFACFLNKGSPITNLQARS
jgi:hypothetical protein